MSKSSMAWFRNNIDGMDENCTDEDCLKILEQRGRDCTPRELIDKAKEIYSQTTGIEPFLAEFSKIFEMLQVEDGAVRVVYPKCFCHQIAGIPPEQVPDEYCECSRNWIKELFEQATGQDVYVQILQSVIRGAKDCRFSIRFP